MGESSKFTCDELVFIAYTNSAINGYKPRWDEDLVHYIRWQVAEMIAYDPENCKEDKWRISHQTIQRKFQESSVEELALVARAIMRYWKHQTDADADAKLCALVIED